MEFPGSLKKVVGIYKWYISGISPANWIQLGDYMLPSPPIKGTRCTAIDPAASQACCWWIRPWRSLNFLSSPRRPAGPVAWNGGSQLIPKNYRTILRYREDGIGSPRKKATYREGLVWILIGKGERINKEHKFVGKYIGTPWDGDPFIINPKKKHLIFRGYLLGPIIPYDVGRPGMSKWSDPTGWLFHPFINGIYWGYHPLTLPSRKFTYPTKREVRNIIIFKYAKNQEQSMLIPLRGASDPNFRPGTCTKYKRSFPKYNGFLFTPKKRVEL